MKLKEAAIVDIIFSHYYHLLEFSYLCQMPTTKLPLRDGLYVVKFIVYKQINVNFERNGAIDQLNQ